MATVRAVATTGTGIQQSGVGSTTCTVTKPTGLQANDLLVAVLTTYGTTFNTASGWTEEFEITDGSNLTTISVQTKVATSGDASASDFSFNTAGTNSSYVIALFAITDYDEVSTIPDSETDSQTTTTNSVSFTADLDTTTSDAIVIAAISSRDNSNTQTLSEIVLTPSSTMTNAATASGSLGAERVGFRCDYTTSSARTTYTNYATNTTNAKDAATGVFLVVRPNKPSSG